MPDTRVAALDIRQVVRADAGLCFDAGTLPNADVSLLEPAAWPSAQRLSGRGGRGSAWRVQGDFGTGVLRQYRRGGLIGRWVSDRYLYLGAAQVRCVREFMLMAELYRLGLPVPRPLLAGWQRQGLFYRAQLLTWQVPGAITLAEALRGQPVPWQTIGQTLGRFHRHGVFHADLNAHNVLLDAQGKPWLIDFDRGQLRTPAPHWQQANLARLKRSLDKLGRVPESAWQALLQGHAQGLDGAGEGAP